MVTRLSGCDELRVLKQSSALIGREPVAKTDAKAPDTLHAADACGQLRTEEASVGRLVRHAPNGGQAKVDRGGCVLPLLKVNPIPEDTVRLKARRGSEQYQATNSRFAWS